MWTIKKLPLPRNRHLPVPDSGDRCGHLSPASQFALAVNWAGSVVPAPLGIMTSRISLKRHPSASTREASEFIRPCPTWHIEKHTTEKQTQCVQMPRAIYIYIYTVTVIWFSKDRSPSARGYGLDWGVPGWTVTVCFSGTMCCTSVHTYPWIGSSCAWVNNMDEGKPQILLKI